MSTVLPDPSTFGDRACREIDQEVFFPVRLRPKHIGVPQRICRGCPRLSECAAWAEPLVRSGELHSCIVASVAVPRGPETKRNERADALAEIAAAGQTPEVLGGAA